MFPLMNFPLHVSSEIGKLQQVIVHCPDNGIDRISPRRAEELLFDDIVYLRRMREEHNVFTDVLKMFLGATNVLEAEDLILEALEGNSERKQRLLHDIARFEELPEAFIDILANLPDTELKDVLITGYHAGTEQILFDPIPNFIFTRDIAVMINDHVLVTKPSKEARFRENFLTRFIFWDNPRFASLRTGDAGARIINLNKINRFPPSKGGEPVSIEGGDVMIINEKYLLIGCSERSTAHGIDLLKAELFARGVVENVVQINIPAQRSCMHIDTIFTQINHNHIVSFAPLVEEGLGSYVQVYRRDGSSKKYLTISDFFRSEERRVGKEC